MTQNRISEEGEEFQLSELLPPELANGVGHYRLCVKSWSFHPDQWSRAFLRGLRNVQMPAGRPFVAWEIGTGTGINLMMMGSWHPHGKFQFSDSDGRCTNLATVNLQRAGWDMKRFHPLPGNWDLVQDEEGFMPREAVDLVFACIPQVVAPRNDSFLAEGDHRAHYYDPRKYEDGRGLNNNWHRLGLGLNAALLARAKNVLGAAGRVVLNLSGRPGLEQLEHLFATSGYNATILHQEMIAQDPTTDLQTLAAQETAGENDFEFYAHHEGRSRINARMAERRRKSNRPLFHKIYVIEGTLP